MLDFNNKKNILRRLRIKGEKNWYWRILCSIAALFVRIGYDVACAVSMIFSDRHGNLFGIKGLGKGDRAERRAADRAAGKKARRQDDIVYVKKPIIGRLLSAVLAMSFVMMFVPELDLGFDFTARAADGQVGYEIPYNGTVETFYEDTERRTGSMRFLYLAREYDTAFAEGNKVSDISYDVGYGNVVINWKYNFALDQTRYSLKGFTIMLYDGNGELIKEQIVNSGQQRSITLTDLGLKSVFAVVYPRIGIQSFDTTDNINADTDNSGVVLNPRRVGSSDDYIVIGSTYLGDPAKAVTLDARFTPPTVYVDGSIYKDIDKTNKVTLTWAEALQEGGNAVGTPATGYRVYMSTDGGDFSFRGETAIPVYEYTVQYGHHYQFFVEAYRNVWNDNGSFNAGNAGLISSSVYNGNRMESATASAKAASIYTDAASKRAHAYIAPYQPSMTVTPTSNNSSYLISVRNQPASGTNYSGVFLFRTTGAVPLEASNISGLDGSPYDGNFGKWLVMNCMPSNDQYGVKFLSQMNVVGNNTTLTYSDTDITAGVTYWYYAVAYLDKGNNEWLYSSSVERQSSMLELNLSTPLWVSTNPSDGQVTLTWERVPNADGYELEIIKTDSYTNHDKDDTNNEIVPKKIYVEPNALDVGNRLTYTHSRLYNDDEYQYRVRAYINVKSKDTENSEEKPRFYSGWSYASTVKVGNVFEIPQNVTATTVDGKVTITWEKVEGATGYILYYKEITEGEVINVKDEYFTDFVEFFDGLTKTTYTHTNLENGKRYAYYIKAYKNIPGDGSHGTQRVESERSNSVSIRVGVRLVTPQDMKTTTKDGEITISWTPVAGAEGYILHIIGPDGSEEEIEVTKPPYTHVGLKNGDKYTYYVEAFKTVNGAKDKSDESVHVSQVVGDGLGIPQDFKATTTDGQITVSWSAVDGAQGYVLEFKSPEQSWDIYGTNGRTVDLSRTIFNHTRLNNGDVYEYRIRAYKTVNGDRVYSDYSVVISMTVGAVLDAPKDFSVVASDGKASLSWSKVTGAEGYIIYAYSAGRAFQFDVSKTTYEHTGLSNGDSWTYYVVAYKTVNSERTYSPPTKSITVTIGISFGAPKDFKVVTTDGKANLTWTAVNGVDGYIVYAYSGGRAYQFDVSKPAYEHTGLANGDSWTYYVRAYKYVNGETIYSDPTKSITVKIGISINAVLDLKATAGNHQIDLTWSKVTGAEGYVVYLYNSKTMEFEPIGEVTGTKYSHIGLKNGTKYTYMVAPFKTIAGERFYGDYSIAVSAIPTTGSTTDVDRELNVKGTAPYGISHSEYMSADANHDAFDESVDVYFTTNQESTKAVRDVLKNYANGLSSFVIYPFDISIYQEGTKIKVDPADGYTVTITMPIPDILIAYREYLTVVHINDKDDTINDDEIAGETIREADWYDNGDQRLEVLPCAIVDIDNVWCVQFKCSSFSPYALVIYKEHIQDVSAGFGIFDGSFAGTFNTGGLLLFTALPDIMPHNKKLRVVRGNSKRYRIKNIEKK